ncbi:hypothetical protein T10_11995 [Trichinella papuae]|uniref:Uncharacterized protein n=1 Tax=Trichinella papuae TaxID=268474 RepID=A0A0V1N3B1_9BILA|nr:hypothetical protein T10_11995 [Trichinella papuae]
MHVVDIDLSLTGECLEYVIVVLFINFLLFYHINSHVISGQLLVLKSTFKKMMMMVEFVLSDVHSLHSVNESHLKAFVLLASFQQLLLLQIALQFEMLPNLHGYLVV